MEPTRLITPLARWRGVALPCLEPEPLLPPDRNADTCFPGNRGYASCKESGNTCNPSAAMAHAHAHAAAAAAAEEEEDIHVPSQLAQLLIGLHRQRGLCQSVLAQKAGGLGQARLSALELNPGRFTLERLLLILAAIDLELVVRPRRRPGPAAWWWAAVALRGSWPCG